MTLMFRSSLSLAFQMATISKDSLAQFWLSTFSRSTSLNESSFSFDDVIVVEQLISKETRRGSLEKLNRQRNSRSIRFTVNVEVINEIPTSAIATTTTERTLENLSALINDDSFIVNQFEHFVRPWLIDVNFNVNKEFFSILVDLMNKFTEEFFRCCFIPWLRSSSSIDHFPFFFSNLFNRIENPIDRNRLCIYLSENFSTPWHDNEFLLIQNWFESEEFFFSNDFFELLPNKCQTSAEHFQDNLSFAKVLHKILMKFNENQFSMTDQQRSALKQTISMNTTILSDILMDLLE